MAAKNFHVKNGLSIGTTEVINSSGLIQTAALGSDFNEKVDDRVNALIQAGTGISTTYDDSAGTLTINGQVGDVTGVTAGDGLSGGGSSGDVSLALDLNELTAATIDVAADSIPFIDGTDTRKESVADLVTGMAGTNITASSGTLNIADSVIRGKISASGDLSYDSSTGVISFTNDAGDIEGVTAGDGLSGGGTTGTVSLALDLNELTAASVDVGNDSVAIIDASDNSSKKESIADIMTASAGDGLAASSGVLAVQVDDSSIETNSDTLRVKQSGITNAMLGGSIANSKLANSAVTVNSNSVSLGSSITLDTDDIGEGSSNLYMTTERVQDIVGAMVSGNTESGITVTYEDGDGTLDFSTTLGGLSGTTDNITEGSTNLFLTNERVDDRVNALLQAGTNMSLTYDDAANTLTIASSGKTEEEIEDIVGAQFATNGSHTNITATYDDAGDGAVDLAITDATIRGKISVTDSGGDGSLSYNNSTGVITYTGITDSQVRGKISVTDSGGDGSLAYNNSTGVITYTGPSASEVQAHITAGTGVGISSGEVSIGQAVGTSDNVTFNNLVVGGNLTVNGSTSTVSSTNTTIEDALIELGTGTTGSPSNDAGFVIERGDSDNAFIGFDESADKFIVGTGSFTGASSGNLTISTGTLVANVEGNLTGNVTGNVSGSAGSATGNAATATALQNARTINGASFDGTANITFDTDATSEGSSNLYFTNARARGAVSVTDSGGDGSLAYNSSTGVITYTGPSASEVRAHLSAGTGVGFSGGAISIGQAVATNSDVTFNQIHTDYANNSGQVVRNIYQATSAPSGSDGQVGDLWILYS